MQKPSQMSLFAENMISSYGPYGHFGWDGLAKINDKSWVWEENVQIRDPSKIGRKIDFPGMGLPGVESDPTSCGIILHASPAPQRPHGSKIQNFRPPGGDGQRLSDS